MASATNPYSSDRLTAVSKDDDDSDINEGTPSSNSKRGAGLPGILPEVLEPSEIGHRHNPETNLHPSRSIEQMKGRTISEDEDETVALLDTAEQENEGETKEQVNDASRKIHTLTNAIVRRTREASPEISLRAVICIQATVRGFLARTAYDRLLEYVDTHLAALCIQKWWMVVYVYSPPRHYAAIRIQSAFRSWATTEFYMLQRFAASLIQAHLRGHQIRQQYQETLRSRKTTFLDGNGPSGFGDLSPDENVGFSFMPELEDMGPPSESHFLPSEASDVSEFNLERVISIAPVTPSRSETEERAQIQLEPSQLIQPQNPLSPQKAGNATTELYKMTSSATPLPPSATEGNSNPVEKEKANGISNMNKADVQTQQKKLVGSVIDETLPPSPAKTEVDMDESRDDDKDWDSSAENSNNSASLKFIVGMIAICLISTIIYSTREKHQNTAPLLSPSFSPIKQTIDDFMAPANSIPISPTTPMTPKPINGPNMPSLEKRTFAKARQPSPHAAPVKVRVPVPTAAIFMPATNVIHGHQLDIKETNLPNPTSHKKSNDVNQVAAQEKKHQKSVPLPKSIPVTSIHIPSSDTMHGSQIGEREKKLARSVSKRNFPSVGKWSHGIREHFFETSTAPTAARVEVTGWLEIDGRGMFSAQLEPKNKPTAARPLQLEASKSEKIAVDSNLSFLAEWGLFLHKHD